MNDPLYQRLLEASGRRRLTPEEEARLQALLAANPQAQAEWDEEMALNGCLQQLPDAPLSSNFTARVLQTVEAETAREVRSIPPMPAWRDWMRRFIPQTAAWALLLALGIFGAYQFKEFNRTQVAASVREFSSAAVLAEPAIFQDFEAIRQLGKVHPVSDEELFDALAVLK